MSRAARGSSGAPLGGGAAAGLRAALRPAALLAALAAAPLGLAPAAAAVAAAVAAGTDPAPAPGDSAAAAPFVPGPWRAPSGLPGASAPAGVAPAARSGDEAPPPAAPPPDSTAPAARPGAGRPAAAPAFDPIVPTRGVLMTPLFPGWGQLYAESGWRAVLAFGAETYYWSQLLKYDRKAARLRRVADGLPADSALRPLYELQVEEYREQVRDYAWWSLGALLIIALDAYVDAHLHDFDRDPVPVPDRWDGDAGGGAAGEGAAAAAAEAVAEAEAAAARAAPNPIEGTILLAWRTSF